MRTALLLIASAAAACKPSSHTGESAARPEPPHSEAASPTPPSSEVALPGGEHGSGFDDLRFAAHAGKVVAPAGGTGNLALIDPVTRTVTTIGGFGHADATGGHEAGTTSADEGGGYLFAIDRTQLRVVVIDAQKAAIVGEAKLASSPDYVRWVEATKELWVTEPDTDRIEVFSLAGTTPTHAAFIDIKGGPESLVIDGDRAFTHLWEGSTVKLDVKARRIAATWANQCTGSRGIALDAPRNLVFVGCAEGRATVLDAATGAVRSSIQVGAGVDVIDYDPSLAHLYVPSAKTATLSILGVGEQGVLSLLGTAPTATGAHCVTADHHGVAWVCDVTGGKLLAIADPYPATR
jgi:DNA-binding beta-propeller fold protein YncE